MVKRNENLEEEEKLICAKSEFIIFIRKTIQIYIAIQRKLNLK